MLYRHQAGKFEKNVLLKQLLLFAGLTALKDAVAVCIS